MTELRWCEGDAMRRKLPIFFVVSIGVLVGACSDPATPPAETAQQNVEHMATGTLNSIDEAAGTVNISHSPVPSAGWPEMTMSFKLADPSEAAALKPGERVDFHFEIESGMNATITHIAPIE